MSEKYFYGTTEEGERVEITLSSLMNAKWDSSGLVIRTSSSLGMVEVIAESLVDAKISAEYDDLLNMYEKDTEKLRAENEELRKVNNSTYCAYCNASYERTDDALAQVRDHIKVCEFHPMRKLEAENERLTAERDRYKAALAKIDERTKYYVNYVTGATTEKMLTEIRRVGNVAHKALAESEPK